MSRGDVPSVLLNTRTPWDEPPRARHQLARALARSCRVHFVAANETGSARLESFHAEPGIVVHQPYWPVSSRSRIRTPGVNEAYQRWLFPRLAAISRPDYVVNFDHSANRICRYYPDAVYYCNDYHIRNYPNWLIKRYLERCEAEVASRAYCCISTCGYLRNRLATWNARSHELRLGAPESDRPPVWREPGRPVRAALVSLLEEKYLCPDILDRLTSDSSLSLTIFGPQNTLLAKRLSGRAGVTLAGVSTDERLLDELRRLDVGVAPYRLDDGNPGRTPNKFWHYLAAGIPTVVTPLPALAGWRLPDGFLYTAFGPAQFRATIHEACAQNSPALSRRRYEYSQANTWSSRAHEVLGFLPTTAATRSDPG